MRRIGISLLVAVVISIIGAGWAIDKVFMRLEAPDKALQTATVIGQQLAEQLDIPDAQLVNTADTVGGNSYPMTLLARDEISLPQALAQMLDEGQSLTLESEQGITLYFLLPDTQRILSIALPKPVDTQMRLLLTLLFYALIAFLVLLWLYPLVRRLHSLGAAAKQFGEGQLTQRIATHKRSQIYDIETEFNKMAQRIQDLVDDNKMLSGAVSHDLKTPLARLRFGIDSLSEQLVESEHSNYLTRISDDLTQMESLVEVLLEFARLDQRLSDLPLKSLSLTELVEDCAHAHQAHTQHDIRVVSNPNAAVVLGEPRYINMMINNVLSNALKYANSEIHVSIHSRAGKVTVCIEDDGAGFGIDKPEQWLKPFAKSESTTVNKGVQSHGMGLAIVHRVALWHDVNLQLTKSSDLGGASVCLVFKANS